MEKNKIYFNADKSEYDNYVRNFYSLINLYKNRGISLTLAMEVLEEQQDSLQRFADSIIIYEIIKKSQGLLRQMENTMQSLKSGTFEQNL